MSKEELAFIAPLIVPFSIVCPMVISRFTTGPRPLRLFLLGMSMRLVMSLVWAAMVSFTNDVYSQLGKGKSVSFSFYALLYGVSALHNICTDLMFVSQISFFAKVADRSIGGTYMTVLNTIANLGNKWPHTISLWLLDYTTLRICPTPDGFDVSNEMGCAISSDGYYLQVYIGVAVGIAWLLMFTKFVRRLELLPEDQWHVVRKIEISEKKKFSS